MTEEEQELLHIVPINDMVEHIADPSCICGPTQEILTEEGKPDFWFWSHHSLDGREHQEPGHDAEKCGCKWRQQHEQQ